MKHGMGVKVQKGTVSSPGEGMMSGIGEDDCGPKPPEKGEGASSAGGADPPRFMRLWAVISCTELRASFQFSKRTYCDAKRILTDPT